MTCSLRTSEVLKISKYLLNEEIYCCFDCKQHWLMLGFGSKVRMVMFILLVGHSELILE